MDSKRLETGLSNANIPEATCSIKIVNLGIIFLRMPVQLSSQFAGLYAPTDIHQFWNLMVLDYYECTCGIARREYFYDSNESRDPPVEVFISSGANCKLFEDNSH